MSLKEIGGMLLAVLGVSLCCGLHLFLAGSTLALAAAWFSQNAILIGLAGLVLGAGVYLLQRRRCRSVSQEKPGITGRLSR